MSFVEIDPGSAIPASEQIRLQITGLIRSGQLVAGTRLPSIRQLASDLEVAIGTVARAYAVLESAGLVESRRALGTRVSAAQVTGSKTSLAALDLVRAARNEALGFDEALASLRAAWFQEPPPEAD